MESAAKRIPLKLGRMLRATSLMSTELFKYSQGYMSLIGPRPC